MTVEAIGVVRRIEAGRERALAANNLSAYDIARITGRAQKLPEAKEHWVTVDCRSGVRTILDGPPAPAIATAPPPPPPPVERIPTIKPDHRGVKRISPPDSLPKWPVASIINAVAMASQQTIAALIGQRQTHRLAHVRHVAIYITASSRQDLSAKSIGRQFGDRDHSTILSAIRRAPERIAVMGSLSETVYHAALQILGET